MFSNLSKLRVAQIITTALLGLLLIGLPLTSFPLLIRFTGSLVAPFSAIPLVGIMLIWLLPYLAKKGSLPGEIVPLIYFTLFALIISAGAFFLDGFYSRGRDFFDQSLRAFTTLFIGLSFYITIAAYLKTKSLIHQALLFIYIGGFLLILWSILEIILIKKFGNTTNFPDLVSKIKSALVFQKPTMLLSDRLSAFAYEPSWFVLVFDLVLFPFWMSAVLQRKSLLKFRLWRFQIEDFLLIPGLVVFMFSFPRIGLLAVVVMFIYLGFLWVRRIYRKIIAGLFKHKKIKNKYTLLLKIFLALVLVIIILSAIAGALIGTLKIASTRDFRYQLILDRFILNPFNNPDFSETGLIVLARSLAFYERTIFWFGGWNIFADYPLGVGLGNAGFYFIERMNSLAYGSYEIRNLLYQSNTIINTKSLWVRLLAETGIIGLAIFLTWIFILWRNSSLIRKSQDPIMKIVGLAGKFFVLAYLVEGFSVDSFALPYTWVMAGIITAGRVIVQKELGDQIKPGEAEILEGSTPPA